MPTHFKTRPAEPERRSAATRRAILLAAGDAFAGAGLAGARTDAIAAAAGVNKALLYYYFRSKDQLYEAVVEEDLREFNRQALELLEGAGTARSILLKYVSLHFDFMAARRRYAALYHQLMAAGGRPVKKLVQRYLVPRSQALGRVLERGVNDGEFRQTSSLHTAVSIVGLIVFYFSAAPVLELLGQGDVYSEANLRRRKQEVLEFVRYGLFRDPEGSVELT